MSGDGQKIDISREPGVYYTKGMKGFGQLAYGDSLTVRCASDNRDVYEGLKEEEIPKIECLNGTLKVPDVCPRSLLGALNKMNEDSKGLYF